MAESIRVERTIRADANELYDLVSDMPRMGEWSPENTGGKWVNDAQGPVVGARFKGSNKSGRLRWSTDVVVTAARPGEQFAFDVTFGPFKIANWAYLFEQDGNKTRVTETWTDHRLPVLGTLSSLLIGIRDRPGVNRRNMEATLAKLAAAVEV
jgi:ribosome-associated toxin RatA of RatAB toxin-antitoxin module